MCSSVPRKIKRCLNPARFADIHWYREGSSFYGMNHGTLGTSEQSMSKLIRSYIHFDIGRKKQLFLYCNSVQCRSRVCGQFLELVRQVKSCPANTVYFALLLNICAVWWTGVQCWSFGEHCSVVRYWQLTLFGYWTCVQYAEQVYSRWTLFGARGGYCTCVHCTGVPHMNGVRSLGRTYVVLSSGLAPPQNWTPFIMR